MSIGVIGMGRLGTTLAAALSHGGHAVLGVADADPSLAAASSMRIGAGVHALSAADLVARADAIVLCVPDAVIAELSASLAWRRDQRVVHCSGALSLDALASAHAAGALCGCFHPLQTFPERFGDATRFAGIAIGVEADDALQIELEHWCDELGAHALSLHGVDRARYHAAAVFTSNFLIALHAAAAQTWTAAGLPPELARSALAPLTRASADAIARLPLHEALTGPIARGDTATVAQHLDALRATPELRVLYAQLSAQLLTLPLALPDATRAVIDALLTQTSKSSALIDD